MKANDIVDKVEFNGKVYDSRHGGPFDRGSADSWYSRSIRPHYFAGGSYQSDEIIPPKGSEEYEAYLAGYEYNEQYGGKKEW